ncbi:hypothetical protein RHOFW104T7_14610 [Rhodanobacter thiooxydans]|uniref:DUF3667 domain-containing protein n=1 Tax=Rhodanobacter thiooxydans TaxID=416169 RepID=A0A154QHZ6_9GAMM|nr:DUF3667 domain-containing protein [Rhodanobacter thiooxydans]EIL97721.1 hypothetical protein UUA_14409 [Rhodanobacter thiooxydans LCS2]KZC23304.1 hypothetical protein RHOFW104T7_14610 [Rhodanobacter thiooxydans]MCW0203904.1 DUF3667 domain-containing protein [Rhodanobacter thiooxydans]
MKQLTSHEGLHCANCGAAMQGEFCHECGQSIHGVLKPMHHMVEETVETVLHIDGRIVHTLPPLLLKPGFLTLEYFAGRRVRYIAPFRLMFVLCLLSFFVFHLAIDQVADKLPANGHPLVSVDSSAIEAATSPAEVRKALQDELDGLQRARDTGVLPPNVLEQARVGEQELRQAANQRLAALGAAPMSAASLAASPAAATVKPASDAKPRDAKRKASGGTSEPIRIAWLPDVANARLTALARQFQKNWHTFKRGDPAASAEAKQRMINGVFSALPPTMFVMIPVFAILLKLFYVFRRRLYMEHLIVALHSHAFMFLSLLLITLAGMLSTWLRPHAAWTGYALGWLQAALILWIPTYLLIMQKRVYHQGWPMTLLKFWFVGWCYFWLLTLVLMVAAVLGMAR